MHKKPANMNADTVLMVDTDVLQRTSIAAYLRECGYRVIESTDINEAMAIFNDPGIRINVFFSDIDIPAPSDGFALAQWVRINRKDTHVILCGTADRAVEEAGNLCSKNPHLKKPYEPRHLLQMIRRLQAETSPPSRDDKVQRGQAHCADTISESVLQLV